MQVMLMASPVRDEVVSPPTISTPCVAGESQPFVKLVHALDREPSTQCQTYGDLFRRAAHSIDVAEVHLRGFVA